VRGPPPNITQRVVTQYVSPLYRYGMCSRDTGYRQSVERIQSSLLQYKQNYRVKVSGLTSLLQYQIPVHGYRGVSYTPLLLFYR